MHVGNNMGIMTTLKKPTPERRDALGGAEGRPVAEERVVRQHQFRQLRVRPHSVVVHVLDDVAVDHRREVAGKRNPAT